MAPSDFSTFPSHASPQITTSPFKVEVSDESLEEMNTLVKLSKLSFPIYEGEQSDRKWGVTNKFMRDAKQYWLEKFDWREKEKYINRFPQYKAEVVHGGKPFSVHYAALYSSRKDAMPIALFHGWPGSFLEFLPMLDLISEKYTPETLPYHVIVPSLPGYGYSSRPPLDKDFTIYDTAEIIDKVIVGLGLSEEYFVQGGDVGSMVARILGASSSHVKAVHLNFSLYRSPPKGFDLDKETDWERAGWLRAQEFLKTSSAYAFMHATRPSTIAYTLSASPISLLAWIGEKLLEWTDEDPSLDTILELVSFYWLTETYPTSIYSYRMKDTAEGKRVHDDPINFIHKPTGYSWFPKELAPVPRSYIKATANLVWFNKHDSGGHFAALERPDALLADVEAFMKQINAS